MANISWSIQNGNLEDVKEAINRSNVSSLINGRTPLHVAADYGQVQIADYLINTGADVNAKDNYGITPILAAVWEGHKEVITLLLDKGANTKVTSPEGIALIDCTEDETIKAAIVSH